MIFLDYPFIRLQALKFCDFFPPFGRLNQLLTQLILLTTIINNNYFFILHLAEFDTNENVHVHMNLKLCVLLVHKRTYSFFISLPKLWPSTQYLSNPLLPIPIFSFIILTEGSLLGSLSSYSTYNLSLGKIIYNHIFCYHVWEMVHFAQLTFSF